MAGWIFLGVLVLFVFYFISIYNNLVSYRNRFKNSYAQIDVQLTRRYDLIPNIVETAKSYMSHERETLEAVIQARNQAVSANKQAASEPDAGAIKAVIGAEAALGASLGNFFALSENYPDLKANETMQQVMEDLRSTENKVAFSRQAFNDAVMNYNTYREQFPNSLLAASFKAAELFEIEDPVQRKAVRVSFD
jgi:LemA protein